MTVNTNPATGISYGVVSFNSLQDWVWEEFETQGTNLTYDDLDDIWREDNPGVDPEDPDFYDTHPLLWSQWETRYEGAEEIRYSLKTQDGMKLEVSWLGGAPLLWVFESPHTTLAAPCSPCCPGAGDLDNKRHELNGNPGVITYDLPADWYRTEG